MHHYIATFNNNGTEYFRTFESNAGKVKRFAIKQAVIHLGIWKNINLSYKEQANNLTDFRAITEQEFKQATNL